MFHTYCFFCGFLGHSYKFCLKARDSEMQVDLYPYGAELQARIGRGGPRAVGEPWLVLSAGRSRSLGVLVASGEVGHGREMEAFMASGREDDLGIVAVTLNATARRPV